MGERRAMFASILLYEFMHGKQYGGQIGIIKMTKMATELNIYVLLVISHYYIESK